MKRLLKNPFFYTAYVIPQMILVHAIATFNLDFKNTKPCVSDYYLYFFDWTAWDFFCMYEIVYITIFLVVLIRQELISNRVIIYESTYKIWSIVIKKCTVITIIFPIVNCLIFSIVAMIKNIEWLCNWNSIGSMAKTMIPYFDLHEINTVWIIVISIFLDFLRLQATMLILCIVDWVSRKAVVDYFIIYIFIVLANLERLFEAHNIPIKSFYNYMHLSQRAIYLKGINVFVDITVPIIIWSIGLMGSFLIFRLYRKDMLKD